MKIYRVRYAVWGPYNDEYVHKYFIDKDKADKLVEERDKPWTNSNGIIFHTAKIDEIIETEDEIEAE